MPSQPPPILPAAPYLFQRLERVQERLAPDHLPPLLDPACKTWYVHRIATALAPHLLDLYRHHVTELVMMQGFDALAPSVRPLLQVTTTDQTVVELNGRPAAVEVVSTALAQELTASDEASGWRPMARRVAIDLAAGALETLTQVR